MLLHRRPHSSRRFLFTITCTGITLCHQVEGFPVLVKKATTVVLGLRPLPILQSADASWYDDTTLSALATRSSSDVVHDKVFIPTIASMGVLVILCIYCCYQLVVNRETYGGAYIQNSQHAVGRQDSGRGRRSLIRGLSKTTRGSAPSTTLSVPDSPSVGSNMLDRLQRRREEEHLRELQQQDPYQQYISSNQGYYPYPQQHYQYTLHPSAPGSTLRNEQSVQLQPPQNAHVPIALQPSHPRRGVPLTPSSSDVLSYMTPPEDRKPSLPNNPSRPLSQDYFSPQRQHPAATPPVQSQPGSAAHSVTANYNPASQHPTSRPRLPSTTNPAHAYAYANQPPGYSNPGTNDVQNVNRTPPYSENPPNQN